MDKKCTLTAYVKEAMQIAVIVPNLGEYKDALTIIFNNARDRHELLRVSNDSGNKIYVDCEPSSVDAVIDWLSQFGETKIIGRTLAYEVWLPDFDLDRYEDCFVLSDED